MQPHHPSADRDFRTLAMPKPPTYVIDTGANMQNLELECAAARTRHLSLNWQYLITPSLQPCSKDLSLQNCTQSWEYTFRDMCHQGQRILQGRMLAAAFYRPAKSSLQFIVLHFGSSVSRNDKACACSPQHDQKRLQLQGMRSRARAIYGRRSPNQGHYTITHSTGSTSGSTCPTSERSDAEQQVWHESCQFLINLGLNFDEADGMIAKAFGWKQSSYWGEGRTPTIPDPDAVGALLGYLRELGMSDSDIVKAVKTLPEVLGLPVDEGMKTNVATLEQTWGITGNMLKNVLVRTPGALGFTIDCRGDCHGLCTRCWARL